ncbi:hypothetical protein O3M35_001412 [Rhynocoris fuscipes]|uniref:Uncharacterized protein n=1 Tax=Rhynocoris fuscipes TaxID=488301 RepID=A0AAW1CPX5_9HEMI
MNCLRSERSKKKKSLKIPSQRRWTIFYLIFLFEIILLLLKSPPRIGVEFKTQRKIHFFFQNILETVAFTKKKFQI